MNLFENESTTDLFNSKQQNSKIYENLQNEKIESDDEYFYFNENVKNHPNLINLLHNNNSNFNNNLITQQNQNLQQRFLQQNPNLFSNQQNLQQQINSEQASIRLINGNAAQVDFNA